MAVLAGQQLFGENHAQELAAKQPLLPDMQWHFIGQLQTNKVKYLIGRAALIQSVDRPALLDEIQRRAQAADLCQDILLQINIGEEGQKAGLSAQDAAAMAEQCAQRPNVRLQGIMAIPPAQQDPTPYFRRMRELYEALGAQGHTMRYLSMGMSHDYELAIAHGANLVRVGSAIFGQRAR